MLPQLIETLRVDRHGSIPLLACHLERLGASSSALGYVCTTASLRTTIQRTCASLPSGIEHRLRLLLDHQGKVTLSATPLAPLPSRPLVALAPQRLPVDSTWLRHKTTYRPWFDAATAWLAQHPDYFDLIFFNEHNQLCEGSRSNVYLLLDGLWYTPPVACGLLPGVQREQILASGQALERCLTQADLARAQGVKLSNALRGWFEVRLVDTSPV